MLNLLIKLIVTPIVVIIAANILPNLNFLNLFQPILIGVSLAVIGHVLEWGLLSEQTFWLTNISDFVVSAIAIYAFTYFMTGAEVTWTSAMITAFILGIIEYFVHRWLINTGRARKEPSF